MKQKILFIFIVISSIVASLGTYPYAKDFSHTLFNNHVLSVLIASIFVPAAVSANIALGAYSINNSIVQSRRGTLTRNLLVVSICALAALSTGFMCFVGYYSRLSLPVNITMSVMVVIVNIGIGFSAINTALNDFSKASQVTSPKKIKKSLKSQPLKFILALFIVLSALVVTLTAYLASTHGLTLMLQHTKIAPKYIARISYIVAIFIWTPTAILFANGSRITILRIYDSLVHRKLKFSYLTIVIIIIAFASGSAYAQMALEFFDQCKCIPEVFKNISKHYNLIFYVIMPLAFFISAIVNGYALDNLRKETKKNYGKILGTS